MSNQLTCRKGLQHSSWVTGEAKIEMTIWRHRICTTSAVSLLYFCPLRHSFRRKKKKSALKQHIRQTWGPDDSSMLNSPWLAGNWTWMNFLPRPDLKIPLFPIQLSKQVKQAYVESIIDLRTSVVKWYSQISFFLEYITLD